MDILSGGQTDFFGLDLGTTALRVVQLRGTGPVKMLERYGHVPIQGTVALSDAAEDQAKIAQMLKTLITQTGITTKNVAVNLPSSRVFTTVIDMDKVSDDELSKTINYQADSLIPTPLAQSKIDWAIIGPSSKDPKKVEVLLSSVPNEFIERRLNMLEGAGFNVVAMEPDSMALMRAVVAPDTVSPQLILDLGSTSTDLVITMNGGPHLTRSIPLGSRAFVAAAVQSLNIDSAQAQQFVYKFGVSKDKLEGQVYNAIIGTVDNLMNEIDKSIKFFLSRYPTVKLERIIMTGGASSLPELPLYVANKFGLNVEIGNAWRNVNFGPERQDELLKTSNHFAVAVGLAERN